jgi:hypothetical protein
MTRRSVRVTLICLGVLVTAALGYRVLTVEQTLSAERQQLSSIDTSIDDVLLTLSDVRGVLHAYVAPGQRSAAWEARSAALFDRLRQQLIHLDGAAGAAGRSLNDSLDNLDQITAAEKRVQHYLDFSQPLLAGDVIFTEIRDLVDATAQQVGSVRDALRHDANGRIEQARRQQATLVGSGTLIWIGLALVLALVPAAAGARTAAALQTQPTVAGEALDLSLAPRDAAASAPEIDETTASAAAITSVSPPPVPDPDALRWKAVSAMCSELAPVSELSSLPPAFSRACDILGAKDAIVWVASADGSLLNPVISHGFDPRVLARIGSIPRDSANLTAAAFRDGRPHQSPATASAAGALAVALRGSGGLVGVFSAELQPDRNVAEAVDLATILAAQVAPLVLQAQTAPVEAPQRRQA